jgi:small subunit ribosomal protein S7
MLDGKKSLATKIVYEAIDKFTQRVNAQGNELDAFLKALENATPHVEVKSRRIGGATYQIPVEVKPNRKQSLAIRWIRDNALGRGGKTMIDRLADEILDAANNRGGAIKKKEDVYKMADANKAFAHLKW